MCNFVSTAPGQIDELAKRSANDNVRGAFHAIPNPPAVTAAGSATLRLLLAIEDAWERARQRRDLARLTELELKDIGWSQADALGELSKPFWR